MRWLLRQRSWPAALTSRPAGQAPTGPRLPQRRRRPPPHGRLPRQCQGTRPRPPIRLYLRLRQRRPASGSAETDREALVALFNATDGENWNASANWLSDAPLDEWEGVTTNNDGRVTALVLHQHGLSGEIPAELGSLSNLTDMDLNGNDLSGCVPSSLEDQLGLDSALGDLPFC